MIGLAGQAPGASWFDNGLCLLDPVVFLLGQGVDPCAVTPDNANEVVGHLLKRLVGPVLVKIILTDADTN